MASKERSEELFKRLSDAVVAYDEEAAMELSKAALEAGIDAYDAVINGLAAGMSKVGQLYESKEYFVPEMLLCGDAFYAGLDILRPHIKKGQGEVKGQIVIGTVEGDIHNIGKNLVKTMFEAAGWIVHDLGVNVTAERFVEEQIRTGADIVALSALMTTSMRAMPKTIEKVKARDPNALTMVGGAVITPDVAKLYGADGYADSAEHAVEEATNMICRRRGIVAK